MALQKIIIDGYNVIYTDDRLRRVACKDLERARQGLIEMMRGYLENRDVQMMLVFDGKGVLEDRETVIESRLQVVFSAASQTADELIVSLIRESGNPGVYLVVTSDMADIGGTARSLGCQVVGSKRFLDRLSRAPEPEPAPRGRGRYGTTEYWLKQFTSEEEDGSQD